MTAYVGQPVHRAEGGRRTGRPWHFSREELTPLGEPAFHGEHNRAVFAELGLADAESDAHVTSGALGGASTR